MKEFDGITVLLLEDEYLIALDAEQILTSLGTARVEIVNTLEGASAAAAGGSFDVAVLDLNINGQMSYAVAEALRHKGIPVVFATGYEMRSRQATEMTDIIYVTKPYTREALRDAIILALERNNRAAA